jgi:hypothetical protein
LLFRDHFSPVLASISLPSKPAAAAADSLRPDQALGRRGPDHIKTDESHRPIARAAAAIDRAGRKAVSGSFNTAANWTPAGVPGAADAAVIDAVGTYTVGSSQGNTVEELDTIGTSTLAVNADTFEVTTVINNYGIVAVHDGATLKVEIPIVSIASTFAAAGHGSALLGEGLPVQAQPLLSLPHG